jgi:putative endonuclease
MLNWLSQLLTPRTPTGKALGAAGERLAARHLRKKGYTVLQRNAHVAPGEADLVCAAPDGITVVIVEVKTRIIDPDNPDPIRPEANVHAHKQGKLHQVARALVRKHGWTDRPVRIDIVAVEWSRDGAHIVRHHEAAVR